MILSIWNLHIKIISWVLRAIMSKNTTNKQSVLLFHRRFPSFSFIFCCISMGAQFCLPECILQAPMLPMGSMHPPCTCFCASLLTSGFDKVLKCQILHFEKQKLSPSFGTTGRVVQLYIAALGPAMRALQYFFCLFPVVSPFQVEKTISAQAEMSRAKFFSSLTMQQIVCMHLPCLPRDLVGASTLILLSEAHTVACALCII